MKTCDKCKLPREDKDFSKRTSSKDGLQSTCRICLSQYRKIHYKAKPDYYKDRVKQARERRRLEREDFKKGLSCKVCGEDRWWVLEFHHRNPKEKEYSIGRKSTRSIRKMKEEIEKCDVLCANCHKDFHYQQRLLT